METRPEDARQGVIDKMNAGRLHQGLRPLIPRQEHLVREFVDDKGEISQADAEILYGLLQSNSA
jgi:hypothetical protein